MSRDDQSLTESESRLLDQYMDFYVALDKGMHQPTTDAQRHFVLVCQGRARAETEHELAYAKFRQLAAAERLQLLDAHEKARRSQTSDIQEGYPDPSWSPKMTYSSDPFFADTRRPPRDG